MNLELDNQIVLITGSSRGIGWSIAEGFLNEGATVILTGRDETILREVLRNSQNSYGVKRVLAFNGDLQEEETLTSLDKFIREKTGVLNHIVCNIGSGRSVPLLEENVVEFQRILKINLLNAVGIVSNLLPLLKKSLDKKNSQATVTFIGSICGVEAIGCPVAYASSKAALLSYMQNISRPLGARGIRVNAVSPGNLMFPGSTWERKMKGDPKGIERMLERYVPLKRLGEPSEIANVVVFLASRKASFVSGVNWIVDGGQTLSS